MSDKINSYSSIGNLYSGNHYNYKMNNCNVFPLVVDVTLKESKSASTKFDWSNVEKLFEFIEKTNSKKDKLLEASVKKCSPATIEKGRNARIEKENNHIAKPVTERTAYNTKQLKDSGVKDNDIKRYLTYDGHVNSDGKKILREHGKSYK